MAVVDLNTLTLDDLVFLHNTVGVEVLINDGKIVGAVGGANK